MDDVLDEFLPDPQHRAVQERRIAHSPDSVWRALHAVTAVDVPVVRFLMGIRSLPAKGAHAFDAGSETILETMAERGWFPLGCAEPRHVVIGSIGRFWTLRQSGMRPSCSPEVFPHVVVPGHAKAAVSFVLLPVPGGTVLRTETRLAVGPLEARRLGAYWSLIRGSSGLIRRVLLHAVARRAREGS